MSFEEMIELEDVWKRYRDDWVLKEVTISFEENGLFAIFGDNGSGKTTLIKIMCGLTKPTRGKVRIFGKDIRLGGYKKHLGVLLQENILYEELTVNENLRFYSKFYGFSDLAKRVFKEFGLEKYRDTKVSELSYGWKKRANIVRALLGDPPILLFDEPFAGLDEKTRKIVGELLTEFSEDKIVIFTIPYKPRIDCEVLKIEDKHVRTFN